MYDMATSLKYGKHMLLEALSHPSHAARRRGQQAIEIMLACTNQVDPSTLGAARPRAAFPVCRYSAPAAVHLAPVHPAPVRPTQMGRCRHSRTDLPTDNVAR
ncbi:hypothetical protein RAA17_08705 [Komagataeibacter rhaeticus]|nr:hypothetical protein [Komagataeibacter rhaeticus]